VVVKVGGHKYYWQICCVSKGCENGGGVHLLLGRKTKIEDFFVTSCVFLKIYRAPKTDCLEINQTIFAVGSGCKIDVSKVSTKKFLQTDENWKTVLFFYPHFFKNKTLECVWRIIEHIHTGILLLLQYGSSHTRHFFFKHLWEKMIFTLMCEIKPIMCNLIFFLFAGKNVVVVNFNEVKCSINQGSAEFNWFCFFVLIDQWREFGREGVGGWKGTETGL